MVFNVSSHEPSPAARLLANYARSPFTVWGVRFESFEGFWQGLKFPEGSEEQQRVFALWGEEAKRAGELAPGGGTTTWRGATIRIGSDEHHALARQALRAKVTQSPAVRRALLATGDQELTHVVRTPAGEVVPDSRTLPGAVFAGILMDLRAELRRAPLEGGSMQRVPVSVTVNGVAYETEVEPRLLLSDFLRDYAGLKGVRVACEHGVCGACTILVGGRTARACLLLAATADGEEITTVEGLGADGALHPLQQAFWDEHALQCGYCTPGMLITALELLGNNPRPTEPEVRRAIAGNVCRCTGYVHIVKAILTAAERMEAERR
jgi:carbon-monoxide dehydrogenase small subunit